MNPETFIHKGQELIEVLRRNPMLKGDISIKRRLVFFFKNAPIVVKWLNGEIKEVQAKLSKVKDKVVLARLLKEQIQPLEIKLTALISVKNDLKSLVRV